MSVRADVSQHLLKLHHHGRDEIDSPVQDTLAGVSNSYWKAKTQMVIGATWVMCRVVVVID